MNNCNATRLATAAIAALLAVALRANAQTPEDPAAALERLSAAAETNLRQGELQTAESQYRDALKAGWMIVGTLRSDEHRLADAREAFQRASTSAVDARAPLQALALVHLAMGDADRAVAILTRLAGANGRDAQLHRLLAQALVAGGRSDEAVQEMEEAHGAAPHDPELAFMLASGYLRVKKMDAAERLFEEVAKARPGAETYVLIGRTYRDAGRYGEARAALETALKMNPRVRRAHYYLGTVAVMAEGITRVDEAIQEFQKELKIAPTDIATNLRLGMALVEAQRYPEALAPLEFSAGGADPTPDAYYYLGRCLLHIDRAADAVNAFRRALELSGNRRGDEARVRSVHYQLALALRQTGAADEAATHFAEAQRSSAEAVAGERDRLDRYLADAPDPSDVTSATTVLDRSPLAGLPEGRREELERRTRTTLARAYLNLGIVQAQQQRFGRAAEFFEQAVAADADFPQAQYGLAVAYFNAQQYEKAAASLEPLAAAGSGESDVRKMLALSYLNTEAYEKAAALLQKEPQTASDPALQYAYGLALVRSGRLADAESVFSRLLAAHGNTAELTVLVGQARAQQGEYDAAIESLQNALRLDPRVADANATLGFIYFKQGRLPEAEQALRAELAAHADNVRAQHTLAAVLELENQPDEAARLLRAVLKARPGFADARYLLGKILLAEGAASEAVDHLEGAARLAPGDANIHYQLGQAYQKLGRRDEAQKEFETFQQLKDKRRGSGQ